MHWLWLNTQNQPLQCVLERTIEWQLDQNISWLYISFSDVYRSLVCDKLSCSVDDETYDIFIYIYTLITVAVTHNS